MWPKGTQAPRGTGAEGRGAGECSAVRRGHREARLRGDTSTEVNGTGGCYSGGRERWRRTRKLREATAEAAVGGKYATPARAPPRGRPGRRRGTAGRSRAEQAHGGQHGGGHGGGHVSRAAPLATAAAAPQRGTARPARRPHRVLQLRHQRGGVPRPAGARGRAGSGLRSSRSGARPHAWTPVSCRTFPRWSWR